MDNPFDYLAWYNVKVQDPRTKAVLYEVNLRGENPRGVCEAVLTLLCIAFDDHLESRTRNDDEGWSLYSLKEYDILVQAVEDPVDYQGRVERALECALKLKPESAFPEMLKALHGGTCESPRGYPLSETLEYHAFQEQLREMEL